MIGNKADLEEKRVILKETAENFKNEYDLDLFLETSARTGMNAQELFIEAAKLLYKDYIKYRIDRKKNLGESLKNDNNKPKKKGCCS